MQFYPHSSFFYIWLPRSPVYFYWPLFMQVDGSYFFTGWQLWWVHICKEPINWSSCLWCCPQLFLRPTQTYPPRPEFYQLIMLVPSESNYKKPHIHTPTFLAPFPSLTIYLKVIKLGVLAFKHLYQSFCMWENCMVQKGLRQFFFLQASLSVSQRLTKLKTGLQSNSGLKLCARQHTFISWLLSLNFFCKSLNSFLKKAFSSSTSIFRFTRSCISCFSNDSLYGKNLNFWWAGISKKKLFYFRSFWF